MTFATIERMPAHVTRAYFRRALARLREQTAATAEAADALAAKADRILDHRQPHSSGPAVGPGTPSAEHRGWRPPKGGIRQCNRCMTAPTPSLRGIARKAPPLRSAQASLTNWPLPSRNARRQRPIFEGAR